MGRSGSSDSTSSPSLGNMDATFPSRAGVADLFRRQLLLSLRHEGVNWTLGALRAAAREKFEEAGYVTSDELSRASLDAVAARMKKTRAEVMAYAQLAGLEIGSAEQIAAQAVVATREGAAAASPVRRSPELYSVCLEESDGGSDNGGDADYLRDAC